MTSPCSALTVVSDVAIEPVSMEMIHSPAKVHTTPNTRPAMVAGALSPYLRIGKRATSQISRAYLVKALGFVTAALE